MRLNYHDVHLKVSNDWYWTKIVAQQQLNLFSWMVGVIHRKRGQDATTVNLDQKTLSGFQHSQL